MAYATSGTGDATNQPRTSPSRRLAPTISPARRPSIRRGHGVQLPPLPVDSAIAGPTSGRGRATTANGAMVVRGKPGGTAQARQPSRAVSGDPHPAALAGITRASIASHRSPPRPRRHRHADAPRAILGESAPEGVEAAFVERLAHFAHQVHVVVQVVDARQHRAEHLAAAVEVVQVGAAEAAPVRAAAAGIAAAGLVDRPLVASCGARCGSSGRRSA